ncbi:MAG: 6-hydroxymethylpterin diphosphokinase MptE-like protein [Conexivisphaerales archaeon]
MLSKDWNELYEKIALDLGLQKSSDERATDIMQGLMERRQEIKPERLGLILGGKIVFVFGAGPSLRYDTEAFSAMGVEKINDVAVVAADGATECLMGYGIMPDVVVTDLDGNVRYIEAASREGALLLVHAHGDNVHLLREYVTKFEGEVLATTQVSERRLVHNFGGFTDGDRAAIISARFGAKSLVLAGMDFGDTVGRYSKPYLTEEVKADERKMKKLRWGKKLLELLAEDYSGKIALYNATSKGEELRGYRKVQFHELKGGLI